MFAFQTITTDWHNVASSEWNFIYLMWRYSTSTTPSINSSTDSYHGSLPRSYIVTRSERSVYAITIFIAVSPPILKCPILRKTTTKKKTVPVPVPPPENKQTFTRNLENRDKDSKLPVEEDAGIHSKSFTDGRSPPRVFCSVGLPVQFPCKAMA